MRVVLDTNLWVSAALRPNGLVAQLINRMVQRGEVLLTSPFICHELERVLERLGFPAEGVKKARQAILGVAEVVSPSVRIHLITDDPTDNKILECAVEGQAHVLLTGDLRHIRPLGSFRGIEISTPREFADKHYADLE
jgi:putative PIN family toxin of toxin-antitoxin system